MTANSPLSEYMTRDELARDLKRHPRTIKRWHVQRKGPPYIKIANTNAILYKRSDVATWLESQHVQDH